MSSYLSGREAISVIDGNIGRARSALGDAIETADTMVARQTEIRAVQIERYRALAGIRLDVMQDAAQLGELNAQDKEIVRLLKAQEDFIESEARSIDASDSALKSLENERAEQALKLENEIARYEEKVAEIEEAIAESPDYVALIEAHDAAVSITSRARQKLEISEVDREEKGAPYRDDPLFSYLWKRKFRTADYKASGFTRMMDNWVGRLCKYDRAFLNYERLTELPIRLAEHVEMVESRELEAQTALEAYEVDAMEKGGANKLQADVELLRLDLTALDTKISEAEARHLHLTDSHAESLRDESGPALEARRLLAERLARASFPDLRILSAQTLALDDDHIVDDLVKLRTEQMDIDLRMNDAAAQPDLRRRELSRLEDFRSRFKASRYDSSSAQLPTTSLEIALRDLMSGVSPNDVLSRLGRSVRRRRSEVEPGFGGSRRDQTLGMPDVMGEVLREVIRQAGRSGGGGFNMPTRGRPTSFPTGKSRRRPRRKSSSSGSRKKGGFKRGGGF